MLPDRLLPPRALFRGRSDRRGGNGLGARLGRLAMCCCGGATGGGGGGVVGIGRISLKA